MRPIFAPRSTAWFLFLLLTSCGGSNAGTPPPKTAGPAEPAPAPPLPPPAAVQMRGHFADVRTAHDAVIHADLEGFHAAMERIQHARYGLDLPEGWLGWVEAMQAVAGDAKQAASLPAAAQAVAALSLQCADCHRDTGGGPHLGDPAAAPNAEAASLDAQMRQHAWGAEQLWLGLVAPSHPHWVQGARALAAPPHDRRRDKAHRAFQAALQQVQQMAEEAFDAPRPEVKATRYAELIATCAGCHAALGADGVR
ncbi:MAG: hypothetical protein ACPGUV_01375 [Polyangiales bacterium]